MARQRRPIARRVKNPSKHATMSVARSCRAVTIALPSVTKATAHRAESQSHDPVAAERRSILQFAPAFKAESKRSRARRSAKLFATVGNINATEYAAHSTSRPNRRARKDLRLQRWRCRIRRGSMPVMCRVAKRLAAKRTTANAAVIEAHVAAVWKARLRRWSVIVVGPSSSLQSNAARRFSATSPVHARRQRVDTPFYRTIATRKRRARRAST